MKNKIRIFFLSLSMLSIGFFPSFASTEVVVKGTGFNSFSKGCSKNKPRDKGLHEATMEKAKKKAWRRFVSKQEDDVIDTYDDNEDEILENLDEFILDMSVLNQECDKSSKTYELIVRLTVDDRAFKRFLTKATGNTSRQGALAGQTTLILLYPRVVSKTIDAKRADVSETISSFEGDEVSDVNESSASITERSVSKTAKIKGGSTTASRNLYKMGNQQDAQASATRALRRFKMRATFPANMVARSERMGVDASFLNTLRDEFIQEGNYSFNTLANLENFSMDIGAYQYIVLGSIDLSEARTDQQSGLPRVTAIVNIELYEATMDGNFVLATANESYNAVAETREEAQSVALKKAAKTAIEGLFTQI
ncbi:MAG: hypothetical protein CMG26_05735 [Candidatus Marinimicrobia bacterium]|nr:hypothetical protein [Candidatus Neomarinimicrobiota bacterium]